MSHSQLWSLFDKHFNHDLYFEIISFLEISDIFNLSITSKTMKLCQVVFQDHFVWKLYYSKTVERIVNVTHNYSQYLQVTNNYRQSLLSLLKEINERVEQHSQQLTLQIQQLPELSSVNSFPFITFKELTNSQMSYQKHVKKKCESISVVGIGSSGVGKTSLFMTLRSNQFPNEYIPSVFDMYFESVEYKDMQVGLYWRDTKDDDSKIRLIHKAIFTSDVFLLFFDCTKPHAFIDEYSRKWVSLCHHFRPGIPIVFVATKIELRKDPLTLNSLRYSATDTPCKPITTEQGQLMAKKMGCFSYIETSGQCQIGLQEIRPVIIEAYLSWLSRQEQLASTRKCQIQ